MEMKLLTVITVIDILFLVYCVRYMDQVLKRNKGYSTNKYGVFSKRTAVVELSIYDNIIHIEIWLYTKINKW